MKRMNSRVLRHNAEMSPIAEYDSAYIGKHESIVDSIAEIFTEVCEALDITAEYIAELTAPAREIARKVTARVRKRINKLIPVPEFHPVRNVWKGVMIHGTV